MGEVMDVAAWTHLTLPLADAALLFVFLIAAGVTALTFTGFTIWVGYHLIRALVVLVARGLVMPGRCHAPASAPPASYRLCADNVCRTANPHHARFCRQCGRLIHKSAHLAA